MNDNISKKENKKRRSHTESKAGKTGRMMLRALMLAVVFCLVVFGAVALSDLFSSDDTGDTTPEIIAVTVSGKDIILNDEQVDIDGLRTYLSNAQSKGELYTVALINDTDNPADCEVYNEIVDLLAQFDIICEKMSPSATVDEIHANTD